MAQRPLSGPPLAFLSQFNYINGYKKTDNSYDQLYTNFLNRDSSSIEKKGIYYTGNNILRMSNTITIKREACICINDANGAR